MTFFAKTLIEWYLHHKRDLPWRSSNNPYHIWLSEIMLQQTRVSQGMPYYFAFTDAFPTVFELAQADEQQVLKLWQGLGYYSRARNLHATAKTVAAMGGNFPNSFEQLRKLKGVGDYTAAAIASIAFSQPVPVIDGNVFRVMSRFFGLEDDIAQQRSRKVFWDLAIQNIPHDDPGTYNQAVMEFGALQCVPRNPDCGVCPLRASCSAFQTGAVSRLPVKSGKAAPRNRYLNYLVILDDAGQTILKQRTQAGIWKHLYEFPVIEAAEPFELSDLEPHTNDFAGLIACEPLPEYDVIHKLTHQTLHITFTRVQVKKIHQNAVGIASVAQYPFPVVLANFIERYFKS